MLQQFLEAARRVSSVRGRGLLFSVGWVLAAGCAEGVSSPLMLQMGIVGAPPAAFGSATGDAGVAAVDAAAEGPSSSVDAGLDLTGEPCAQDETVACTCLSTGTDGERECELDDASPMDGFLSACRHCAAPAAASDDGEPPGDGGRCADGDKNGFETATDCGGPDCEPCLEGQTCVSDGDCVDSSCNDGVCSVSCDDGKQNGGETDVDCGGRDCFPCPEGSHCEEPLDCIDFACADNVCRKPAGL